MRLRAHDDAHAGMLATAGVGLTEKAIDLECRSRCRECDARGRAALSIRIVAKTIPFMTKARPIGIAELVASRPELRDKIVDQLRGLWSVEAEPEIKLSIATTIIGAVSAPDAPLRPTR